MYRLIHTSTTNNNSHLYKLIPTTKLLVIRASFIKSSFPLSPLILSNALHQKYDDVTLYVLFFLDLEEIAPVSPNQAHY